MTPLLRKWLFETLYKNRYLYRFASTVPFAGQWRVWQRLVLQRIYGKDVLELGCGLGDLLADMLAAGYQCRAVEHSSEMVSAARATLRRRNIGNEAVIIQGSAQALPFGDGSFDSVVSTFPSEYIYDPNTIAEVARVLRTGGRLIVIEGANLLPSGFLQPLLLLIQMFVYGPRALFGSGKEHQSTVATQSNAPDEELERNRPDHNTSNTQQTRHETERTVVTEIVQDAWFGRHIPLEKFGLHRRSERVRSRRWEVYITIGEKF